MSYHANPELSLRNVFSLQLWTVHPSKLCVFLCGWFAWQNQKTEKELRSWERKVPFIFHMMTLHFPLNMHVSDTICMVLGTKINRFFLSHDESKLCLSFIIVATPTVKLYYSCVKTSSNLKIGHEAAKKPTHSVILILYWKGKIQLMHFGCKNHFVR